MTLQDLKNQLVDLNEKYPPGRAWNNDDMIIRDDLKEKIKKMEADEIASKEDITFDPEKPETDTETPVPEESVSPEPVKQQQVFTARRCARCRKTIKYIEQPDGGKQYCKACIAIRKEGEPIIDEQGIQVGKLPPM